MKVAILYSGGKDSNLALQQAIKNQHEVTCLITIISQNKESYMLQTANIQFTKLQAQATQIPLITQTTKGIKEKELKDIKKAIQTAKKKYNIQAIYTGAISSNYQKTRIQKICQELNLKSINPLWKTNQQKILQQTTKNFKTIITGTAVEQLLPYLGQEITQKTAKKIIQMSQKHKFNPAGEGGEIETTVIQAPHFKKKIHIKKIHKTTDHNSGHCTIEAEIEK